MLRAIKLTIVIVEGYHCYKIHTEFYLVVLSQGEIIGDRCGFRCNRSTADQIFCIYRILEKKKNGRIMGQYISCI